MQYQDYYRILSVNKSANPGEIQRAYRKLARTYHPDINKDPSAEARFKEIGEAYEVLKDEEKRARYDRYGSAWKSAQTTGSAPPGWEGFNFDFGSGSGREGFGFDQGSSGFSSFFDMLFSGSGGGRWRTQPPTGPRRGADHESELHIELKEAVGGGQRQITLTDPESGETRTLQIKIPKGVRSGRKIRLAGRGGAGTYGGPAGDLLLRIEIEPHPQLRVEGSNLLTRFDVTPSVAALGGEAEVTTLEGPIKVKLPAGSSSGRKIRLKGKGLPEENGRSGDLLAEVRIVVPSPLSDEQRELFKKLEEV